MSYRFVKETDGKEVGADSFDVESQDNFVINKKIFNEDPESFPREKEPVGEDFLIPREEIEVEEYAEESDEESSDIFLREKVPSQEVNHLSYEDIQQQKSHYLYQLSRFRKRGIEVSRRLGMEHSLDEISGEVYRIKKELDMDSSIDYCRQGLMFCVSTIEMVNGTYNLGGNLNNWSQTVMSNIDSYDEVFEELYEKYYKTAKMEPEIKLISMLAGSAFMFHLQKSLLNNETVAPRQREMTGPSIDTDELLRELNNEVDLDDISSIASSEKSVRIIEQEKKSIPIKKRGRPKTKK